MVDVGLANESLDGVLDEVVDEEENDFQRKVRPTLVSCPLLESRCGEVGLSERRFQAQPKESVIGISPCSRKHTSADDKVKYTVEICSRLLINM